MTKKIDFMCTAFRDGFQSAYGARVLTPDFLPGLEAARDAGIRYFEAGGGARFQSLYFYCNEDAFAMMDTFRDTVGPEANLQTLARGVNVVGLESQPSDIIKLHAELFKQHGITTIRNFDALNDVENLIYSGRCIVDAGLKHQVTVTMMELPPGCTGAHDAEFYAATLEKILAAEIPFDAVCFKDASGTAVPSKVYDTIRRARQMLPGDTYIHFHTHETAGVSVLANKAALDAGANAIDLSLAPCSGGTCQPDLLVMWHALRGSDFALDVDIDKIRDAEEVLKECLQDYYLPPEALAVEPLIPWSPMPGGALTANTQMLRDNGIMDRYPEVIKAMSDVVRRGGYGTSVTPVSQFYFQQAYNNVMFGPWEKIAEPYGQMVLGYFGRTPVPPDPEIVALAAQQLGLEPTTESPLTMDDANPEKGSEAARQLLQAAGLDATDENVFITATCKEKGIKFLQGNAQLGIRKKTAEQEQPKPPRQPPVTPEPPTGQPAEYTVRVNDKEYFLAFEGNKVTVDGSVYHVVMQQKAAVGLAQRARSAAPATLFSIPAATGEPPPAAAHPSPPYQPPAPTHAPPPRPAIAPRFTTAAATSADGATVVAAQMPGVILRLLVKPGDRVDAGQSLLIMESMKMEVPIASTVAGTVSEISVSEGDHVANGQALATVTS